MTVGTLTTRPAPPHNETATRYFEHSSAPRVNTDAVIVEALRADYPELHITVVPQQGNNLFAYASAGHASLAAIDKEKDRLTWKFFLPPASRLTGQRGALVDRVKLGRYLLDWQGKEFILCIADGRDGEMSYPSVTNQYILSGSVEATNKLLFESGAWNSELHNEIFVFDGGFWQKSAELWDSVQKSNWEDVILDEGMKKAIISDVENFFDSRETYERLKVAWKRGIIYYGPPGNGKTISIKAMMNSLYKRKIPAPTLYVKTLNGFGGPEYSINQVFSLARRTAPCYLIFEDLDSIINESVRSYFLNAVDGIEKNDGILMVGSTNHLDRLDPGLAKRPSRFDRKYLFPNPNFEEREKYMVYWQHKLSDNHDLEFPDKLCPAVAKITNGFSFAYLQEAMVASLLAIARDQDGFSERVCLECLEAHAQASKGGMCDRDCRRSFKGFYDWVSMVRRQDEEDPDLDNYVLWREIKKQVRILKEELGEEKGGR
ncbi:hypothetical protein LTR91_003840 [Friedmanniomyces endolithicus]|uniref:AAA+ ATPase domain-containing protein n=1 Tax=Friedmanniomyces endolithicus TaxID=329885 RepID=A0AAN6QZF0_9PEZI|nr:hypothetical protein LTR57_003515 [Friedmanniomyces endolithicus]KAK0959781.1 hypothetical protein LTS01_021243 [Friedmanniomyces endolithicus]KAK1005915.1 hypothetical protein LTR91_003840 [Friedmanniomyces endolithicus]KAK1044008.1 hypothetical protein LTS16_007599 [Friedmanniomyces endolithicus]